MVRHHRYLRPLALIFQVVLISLHLNELTRQTRAETVVFEVPNSKRTEGRVTLEYVRNDETIRYQLAFSEVVDADTQRSAVNIGYVSYDPTSYYSRGGNILTVDKAGVCNCYRKAGYKFVPELDWFLRLTWTQEELEKALTAARNYHIGPTGVVLMLTRYTKFDHVETHRNVECQVTAARYDRARAKDVLYEVLVPNLKMFDSPKMNFFTVRETVKNAVAENGDKFSTTMTIDYFYTEEIDKTKHHQLERLETELNLPFGKGCSAFLEPTRPSVTSQSFIMAYAHNAAQAVVSLAYDHASNYLRKELVGRSVAIWDLNEDLLYHVDQKVDGKLYSNVDIEVPLEACSVLSVEQTGGGEADKKDAAAAAATISLPYERPGKSVDVLEFLGARELYYMGQTTVRDLPCQVFETLLPEPPRIFDVDLRVDLPSSSNDPLAYDYIVQFYIFKTNEPDRVTQLANALSGDKNQQQPSSWTVMVNDQFWPARISLLRRHKQTGTALLIDQLDVSDFHWGLYGWTKKPSELFMLPECFSDEDEQLRLDLALDFDRLNLDDNHKVLRHSKYKLEKELLEDLFKLLGVSRLHLTEFQLQLRPHDVLANLVISDRIESKKLTYFGPGDLPNANSYLNNRILLQDLATSGGGGGGGDGGAESACVLLASHVSQISMVIFCPRQSESQAPTCTAIFGEQQPVIKRPASQVVGPTDPLMSTQCQVYRFEPGASPKAATGDVQKVKLQLLNHRFTFDSDTTPKVTFNGLIQDFDVTRELQLITINNYKYTFDAKQSTDVQDNKQQDGKQQASKVRAFENMPYDSLGDCTRMCAFDAACKSYSYCQDKTLAATSRCVLASLDLRQNNVENQLVSAKVTSDNQIIVRDLEPKPTSGSGVYLLDLKSGCNIYEKNALDGFTQTEEQLRIDADLAKQFLSLPSAAECARWVQSLEEQIADHSGAMFAYCANTNTCLVDEDLFVSLSGNSEASARATKRREDDEVLAMVDSYQIKSNNAQPSDSRELSCQVYRKRYQNYFRISHKVIKRQPQEVDTTEDQTNSKMNPIIKQMELEFNSVEQCARACFDSFGHNCVSFDFCLPQSCLINLINEETLKSSGSSLTKLLLTVELETRTGCLHYERDLKWDKLKREHLVGKHTPLNQAHLAGGGGGGDLAGPSSGFVAHFGLLVVTSILFILGLAVGRIFTDRLDNVALLQRRAGGGARGSGAANGDDTFSASGSIQQRMSSSSKFNIENEIYEDPNAIKLQDFGEKRGAGAGSDDDGESSNGDGSSGASQSPPGPTPPGHMEVPNLMSI